VEARGKLSQKVTEDIRKHYPAFAREPKEEYGRILVIREGQPPFVLCAFPLDLEARDVLDLFWVKLEEYFPKEGRSDSL